MLPMGGNYSDSSLSHVMSQLTATGRLHSVAKGSFWEAKSQRQLYGDEFGTVYFACRPNPAAHSRKTYRLFSRLKRKARHSNCASSSLNQKSNIFGV